MDWLTYVDHFVNTIIGLTTLFILYHTHHNVKVVAKQTNHIHDSVVREVRKIAYAAGKKRGEADRTSGRKKGISGI